MKPQTAALKAGVEVLIATPGRLLDHIEAKNCVLNQVEYVVLDEADRMLDIGFLPDLQRILSFLPKAAPDPAVLGHVLARDQAPGAELSAGPHPGRDGAPQPDGVHRRAALLSRVDDDDKRAVIRQILRTLHPSGHRVRQLQAGCGAPGPLVRARRPAHGGLHGDKSQDERLKALDAFKRGETDRAGGHRRGRPRS